MSSTVFFFNDTATTEIYTLSLHDALPISSPGRPALSIRAPRPPSGCVPPRRASGRGTRRRPERSRSGPRGGSSPPRSEEHTSELQSLAYLVCRLLLEKKKNQTIYADLPDV